MSSPRFAAITASLLARKGEAQPWTDPAKKALSWEHGELPAPEPAFFRPPPPPPLVQPVAPRTAAPKPPVAGPARIAAPHADAKKIAVRMSHHDYERLGILAVKQDKSRQRLLQEAVERLLAGIAQNFGGGCACLGAEQAKQV